MLDGLFKPRSIAIIGASNNPFSIGHIVLRNLVEHRFQGPIFPINPKTRHIGSFKTYRTVLDVPDDIDLVNISVNYNLVPGVLEECGKKGVKFAIVHTAGFKEVGAEGLRRERDMVEIAHHHGMRIFGPNSQGVQNSDPAISAYANFTFVPMRPGNISIIAQGGGMGELLKLHLHKVGLGHRLYCSYGNEADLTMPELLEYYGADVGTRVIMMQIESFKAPARFLEVASRITPNKPVLAIKAGRTREGSVAVSSHTGTLVDQAAMATAMFRKAGVVQFYDSDEMIKAAIALSSQPLPRGKKIGIITNTGGPGIQAVDEAVEQGLTLATWSDGGRERLKGSLYAEASLGNPVDVVATAGPDHYFAAVDTLLKEEGVDMVMVYFVTAPFVDLDGIANRIIDAVGQADKPVVVVIETIDKWAGLLCRLREAGVPVYEFAEDGARSLAAMAKAASLRERPGEAPPFLKVDREGARALLDKFRGQDAFLHQKEAYDLLATYGIPVPAYSRIVREEDLDEAARKVGFPCVLKVDSPEVVHKSDVGGVIMNIENEGALSRAFQEMSRRFPERTPLLLQEQRPGGLEVILGAAASPGLGSLVLFGLGGIFVEVIRDVAFAVAPLSVPEAREIMASIKGHAVLDGVRGRMGVDRQSLEDLMVRFSLLAADFPCISEIDLNPVLAYDRGFAVVDVRVRVRL